jgi:hypothetical protein
MVGLLILLFYNEINLHIIDQKKANRENTSNSTNSLVVIVVFNTNTRYRMISDDVMHVNNYNYQVSEYFMYV